MSGRNDLHLYSAFFSEHHLTARIVYLMNIHKMTGRIFDGSIYLVTLAARLLRPGTTTTNVRWGQLCFFDDRMTALCENDEF